MWFGFYLSIFFVKEIYMFLWVLYILSLMFFNLCFVLLIKNFILLFVFFVFVSCLGILFGNGRDCRDECMDVISGLFCDVSVFFSKLSFWVWLCSFCFKFVVLFIIVFICDIVLEMNVFEFFIYLLEIFLLYVFVSGVSWVFICFFRWRIKFNRRFRWRMEYNWLCLFVLDCFIFCKLC